jgi:hypothetical protein
MLSGQGSLSQAMLFYAWMVLLVNKCIILGGGTDPDRHGIWIASSLLCKVQS